MSFGFPKNNDAISEAIHEVKRKRRIVFISSAGNSSSEKESFPARHPNVLSVFATNYKGVFSSSNAKIEIGDGVVIGTFGEDIPSYIYNEFEERFPGICRPGSSIATAVTAGISATMLAYATVLPKLLPAWKNDCRALEWLQATEGLEAVFKKTMARPQDQIQKRFLDPTSFWRDTPEPRDFRRLCSILTSLNDVEKQGEL